MGSWYSGTSSSACRAFSPSDIPFRAIHHYRRHAGKVLACLYRGRPYPQNSPETPTHDHACHRIALNCPLVAWLLLGMQIRLMRYRVASSVSGLSATIFGTLDSEFAGTDGSTSGSRIPFRPRPAFRVDGGLLVSVSNVRFAIRSRWPEELLPAECSCGLGVANSRCQYGFRRRFTRGFHCLGPCVHPSRTVPEIDAPRLPAPPLRWHFVGGQFRCWA